jgi:hypothetical protein
MGDVLYHAGVDQSALGNAPTFYAGRTTSTDSCSVSACDPHSLDYVAPPLGGAAAAAGTAKTSASGTTYTIDVPLTAIGKPTEKSLLEEVSAYVFAAPTPASLPNSKPQTDAEEVPLLIEGARAFNFAAASAPGGILSPTEEPGTSPDQSTPGRNNGPGLATTGLPVVLPAVALLLVIGGVLLRRRRA